MQAHLTGSVVEAAESHHTSPLPHALGVAGALAPFLVLWASDPTHQSNFHGFRAFHAWGMSSSFLSGLVSTSVGTLLRKSRSWIAFLAVAIGLGTTFGTFVACASFPGAVEALPAVIPFAVGCAGALTFVATGIFAAHWRLLGTRAGSLTARLDSAAVWTATAMTVVAVAWFVNLSSPPSAVRVAIAGAAVLGLFAFVFVERRCVAELRAVIRGAGERVEGEPYSETLHDLGVGTDLWVGTPAAEAYRTPGRPLQVIRGSLEAALRRARRASRMHVVVVGVAVLGLLHVASSWLFSRTDIDVQAPVAAQASPLPPPIRTGSWYPSQEPILTDINHDGVEDLVSLRWESAEPARALFVTAHDGASLRPIWATAPIPSQWMSPATHLVMSGSVLFLTDSERQLHLYDLKTGRSLHAPLHVDGIGSLCVPAGGKPGLWLLDADSFAKGKAGLLVDASGHATKADRPPRCAPVRRSVATLGEWDEKCAKKLASTRLRSVTYRRQGDIGLGLGSTDGQPFAIGYDPETCTRRWQTPIALTDEALHPDPHLSNRLDSGRLYSLYQLQSGGWMVGVRDAKSGRSLWHRPLPQAERGTDVERLFVGQHLYVARDWRLDVLALDNGKNLGRI